MTQAPNALVSLLCLCIHVGIVLAVYPVKTNSQLMFISLRTAFIAHWWSVIISKSQLLPLPLSNSRIKILVFPRYDYFFPCVMYFFFLVLHKGVFALRVSYGIIWNVFYGREWVLLLWIQPCLFPDDLLYGHLQSWLLETLKKMIC